MVIGTRNVVSLHRAGRLRNLKVESEEVPDLDNSLLLHDFENRLKKIGFRAWRKISRDRNS
jgi:hypothetical protein